MMLVAGTLLLLDTGGWFPAVARYWCLVPRYCGILVSGGPPQSGMVCVWCPALAGYATGVWHPSMAGSSVCLVPALAGYVLVVFSTRGVSLVTLPTPPNSM